MDKEYRKFLDDSPKEIIIKFVDDYEKWLKAQLRVGGLIFPMDDYYFIWRGQ